MKIVRISRIPNLALFWNSFTWQNAAIVLLYSSLDRIKQHPGGIFYNVFWADSCLRLGGCILGTSSQVDEKSCSDAAGCQFGAVSILNKNRLCFREGLSHKSCQSGPLRLTGRQCACVCVLVCDGVRLGACVHACVFRCLFPLHNEEVMSSQTSCWLPLSNSLPSACRCLQLCLLR